MTPHRARPSAVRNVLANWGAFLFFALTGFLLSPFVLGHLGDELYGVWALIGSMIGYLGLLDLGVRGAVTRFVAKLHAAGDHAEAQRFTSAALFAFSITSVLCVVGGLGIAALLPHFNIPPAVLERARIAVVLASGALGLAFLNGVFGGILTARERFDISNAREIAAELVRVAGVVAVLSAGYGLVALALVQITTGFVRLILTIHVSRKLYPQARPSWGGWNRAHMRDIFAFSLTTTGLRSAGLIMMQLDALVIARYLPVAAVTPFAIAGSLIAYARQVISSISQTITPRVSALEGAGALQRARDVPLIAARLGTAVVLPIVITYVIRGASFVGLWMGPEYTGPSGRVLVILSISLGLAAARHIMASALIGLNRHLVLVPISLVEAGVSLALAIVLVRSMGIVGVAWGTTIPSVVTTVLVLPLVYRSVLDVPVMRFWIQGWLRPAVALVPFALATLAVERSFPARSLLTFFLQVAAILPIAAVGAWWVALDRAERSTLRASMPLAGLLRKRAAIRRSDG